VQVLKDTAQVQLLQLVVQDGDYAAEYQKRGERCDPSQAAAILALGKDCWCGAQGFNASAVCT
jgi:hypothetical protein